ncbi:MAG: sensor histidine kinase [Planctomycetota bacterium]
MKRTQSLLNALTTITVITIFSLVCVWGARRYERLLDDERVERLRTTRSAGARMEIEAERQRAVLVLDAFYIWVLTLILGSSAILTWRLHRGIRRDLTTLITAFERTGEGDFRQSLPTLQFSELDPLGAAFIRMERDLADTQGKLLLKNRLEAVGSMAAGIAHELCNPLGGIQGYAELLQEEVGPKGRADVDKILVRIRDCRRIVDDLLLFCRGEEAPLPTSPVALSKLADELGEDLAPLMVDGSDLADLTVDSNRSALRQILVNLGSNARKAGARTMILKRGLDRDGMISLILEDDGPGIPRDVASRIFEPFFTTARTGEGTGLGLSISHGLARRLSGSLSLILHSAPTTFELLIPRGRT